jgi:putative transcriptional regulator
MTADVRELLPLYALGILDPDEAKAVERAIAQDASLASELLAYQETASQLVIPVTPSPDVKARLFASIGAGRFEKFAARMSTLFDVSIDRAREFLGLIERPASWDAAMPGIGLVHFDGGAAYAAADCGFIRLAPGTTFPLHTHRGEEVSLIIAGQLRDQEGRILSTGDELVQAEGSTHQITAIGDVECIFAARAMNGIEIAGAPVRPNRPSH